MVIKAVKSIASLCNIKKLAKIADIDYQRLILALKKEPSELKLIEYEAFKRIYNHFKKILENEL